MGSHVLARAERRSLDVDLLTEILLEEHGRRRRNPGQADWRVEARGLVVLYDWPDGGDSTTA